MMYSVLVAATAHLFCYDCKHTAVAGILRWVERMA